jgi:hypothetical protein
LQAQKPPPARWTRETRGPRYEREIRAENWSSAVFLRLMKLRRSRCDRRFAPLRAEAQPPKGARRSESVDSGGNRKISAGHPKLMRSLWDIIWASSPRGTPNLRWIGQSRIQRGPGADSICSLRAESPRAVSGTGKTPACRHGDSSRVIVLPEWASQALPAGRAHRGARELVWMWPLRRNVADGSHRLESGNLRVPDTVRSGSVVCAGAHDAAP